MKRTLARWWMVAALVGAQAAASPARADQPEAAEAERRRAEAKAHFSEGLAAQQRRDLPAAYQAFQKAWQLHRHYKIGANLGSVETELGKHTDAALHLSLALEQMRATGAPADEIAAVEALYARARAQVAALRPITELFGRPEKVSLALDGTPVELNGAGLMFASPGAHELAAARPGLASAPQRVTVSAGEERAVTLRLRHEGAGSAGEIPAPAPPAGDGRKSAILATGLAAAGVAVAVGVAGTAVALGADSDAEAIEAEIGAGGELARLSCARPSAAIVDRCNAWRDELETRTDHTGLAIGGFAFAGAALIATGAYALWSSPGSEPQVVVVPGGIGLAGRF